MSASDTRRESGDYPPLNQVGTTLAQTAIAVGALTAAAGLVLPGVS